jgi:hypothetical protein
MSADNPVLSSRTQEYEETEELPCGHHFSFADPTNWGRCSHFQCLLKRAYRLEQGRKNLEEESVARERADFARSVARAERAGVK